MDVTRRQFLQVGAAAGVVLVLKPPKPPPPPAGGWYLSAVPGRAAPGLFWPGAAA